MQVGTALVARSQQRRRGNDLRFLTADHRQAAVAVAALGREALTLLPPL
jgi:hypothetical protein